MEISVKLVKDLMEYIEVSAVEFENEHNFGRSLERLIADEEMPDVYTELQKLLASEQVLTLEQRKEEFRAELKSLTQTEDNSWKEPYNEATIKKFWNYWTEISPKGKKYRFEKEKTFNMKLRLNTWMQRSQAYSIVGLLNSKKKNGR